MTKPIDAAVLEKITALLKKIIGSKEMYVGYFPENEYDKNKRIRNIAREALAILEAAPAKDAAPDCEACEGYGCVATPQNDMDGFPVEVACPLCNAPEEDAAPMYSDIVDPLDSVIVTAKRMIKGYEEKQVGRPLEYVSEIETIKALICAASPAPPLDSEVAAAIGAAALMKECVGDRFLEHKGSRWKYSVIIDDLIRAATKNTQGVELPPDERGAIFSDISMRERKWIESYFAKNSLKIAPERETK